MDSGKYQPDDVVSALLGCSGAPQVFTLTLSRFREVFTEVQKRAQATPLDVVLNGDWAMLQFSRLCNHRIRVERDPRSNRLLRFLASFVPGKPLTEADFDFASLYSHFHGGTTHLSLIAFFREEVSTNWRLLLATLLLSWGAFHCLTLAAAPAPTDSLEKINELLLTAATLFLSVFVLFTVSQNVDLVKDPYLFRRGLTHRFFRVDRLLALLPIAVVLLSVLNVVLLNLPAPLSLTLLGRAVSVADPSAFVPLLTALATTVLTDCFLALVRYYFQRVRYVAERQLTKDLLNDLWLDRNPDHPPDK
jgi:hypothetical protein